MSLRVETNLEYLYAAVHLPHRETAARREVTAMQTQIRLSSLAFAALISAVLVAGAITLHPPLTRAYCIRFAGLIAGAGLVVTLYDRAMTAHARRRAEEELRTFTEKHAEESARAAAEDGTAPDSPEQEPAALPRDAAAAAEDDLPESLDGLLDAAHAATEHMPLRAVAAYRRALARYPDDSYMPYLIIELSTLYKRMGDYDAALALFDEMLALPVVAKNAVVVQEFQRSRRFLGAVSAMLAAQGTPALPYGEIPKELLAEADRRAEHPTI